MFHFFIGGLSSLQFDGKGDVRTDGEFFKNVVFLENEPDIGVPVGIEIALGEILRGFSLDDDVPRVVFVQTAEEVQEGGFTATGFSEDENQALVFNFQIDIIKGDDGHAFFRMVRFC